MAKPEGLARINGCLPAFRKRRLLPAQLPDEVSILRELRQQFRLPAHFKISKIKTGCHCAPRQHIIAHQRCCAKPPACGHHGLGHAAFAFAEQNPVQIPTAIDACNLQNAAIVMMPHLIRLQAVKRTEVMRTQQIVNRCREGPHPNKPLGQALRRLSRNIGFTEIAPFGMGLQLQSGYPVFCCQSGLQCPMNQA